jgi:catechol 2,3-dioxygenase-like lactoylglutathione lyase family enzyme
MGMGLSDYTVETAIAVSDLERARDFYERALGLSPIEQDDQGSRYPCGNGTGVFVYLSPGNAGNATATVAGWFVDDLEATMADLSSRGVAFERYDMPGIKTDADGDFDAGDFRAAWFQDPVGNTFAVTQRSAAGQAMR